MAAIELEAIFDEKTGTWDVCVPAKEPDGSDPIEYTAWLKRKEMQDEAADRCMGLQREIQQQAFNLR